MRVLNFLIENASGNFDENDQIQRPSDPCDPTPSRRRCDAFQTFAVALLVVMIEGGRDIPVQNIRQEIVFKQDPDLPILYHRCSVMVCFQTMTEVLLWI
jgi:hypothetical protein